MARTHRSLLSPGVETARRDDRVTRAAGPVSLVGDADGWDDTHNMEKK